MKFNVFRFLTALGLLAVAGVCLTSITDEYSIYAAFLSFVALGTTLFLLIDLLCMPDYNTFDSIKGDPRAISLVAVGVLLFIGLCAVASVFGFAAPGAGPIAIPPGF